MEQEQVQSDNDNQQAAGDQEPAPDQEQLVVKKSAEELTQRLKEVSSEARDYRKRLATEKADKDRLEKEKLAAEGKHAELADRWKREAEEQKKKTEQILSAFASQTVKTKIATEAARMGCIDTDALIQLMPVSDIPIDENFSVDIDTLRLSLDEAKKSRPYLFTKPAPSVKDAVPSGKPDKPNKPDLSKMSPAELAGMLARSSQ